MKIFIIILAIFLILIITFIALGVFINKRNLKKDKYDLFNYIKKHKDTISMTIKEDGLDTLAINAEQELAN